MRLEWRSLRLGLGGRGGGLPIRGSAPFEQSRILDPLPLARPLASALAALKAVFPIFERAPVVQRWAGMIDATPDAIPVISTVRSHRGLVIATGFSGHGFGIGPAAGRLAADLVTGAAPIVDPTAFRYERFIDGTRPRPTTGV